jgi:hypothetical protein
MRYLILLPVLLAGCAKPTAAPPGVQVRVVETVKEVQRPCPVTVPKRPAPLAKPLPPDAVQLAALLGAKLQEWAGAGGYGDRADTALATCTKP